MSRKYQSVIRRELFMAIIVIFMPRFPKLHSLIECEVRDCLPFNLENRGINDLQHEDMQYQIYSAEYCTALWE